MPRKFHQWPGDHWASSCPPSDWRRRIPGEVKIQSFLLLPLPPFSNSKFFQKKTDVHKKSSQKITFRQKKGTSLHPSPVILKRYQKKGVTPLWESFPYYSHTIPISLGAHSYGNGMGIVWIRVVLRLPELSV